MFESKKIEYIDVLKEFVPAEMDWFYDAAEREPCNDGEIEKYEEIFFKHLQKQANEYGRFCCPSKIDDETFCAILEEVKEVFGEEEE